jgi:hypothetical protein
LINSLVDLRERNYPMPTAEARITTDRAERYLDQLCSHLGQMQHMRHLPRGGHGALGAPRPQVEHVERTPGRAAIRFAEGSWTLSVAAGALLLRVEADDPAALELLKDAIAARIIKIGRRDDLSVAWHEVAGQGGRDDEPADGGGSSDEVRRTGPGGRRRWRRIAWLAAIAAAVAIHLGLIGSLLGSGAGKDLAADAILALLAVKLLLFALHARSGRGRPTHGPSSHGPSSQR